MRSEPFQPPTRPGDISHEVPLRTLAERYHEHTWPLLAHQHGCEPLTAEELVEHALAALATGHALAERALAGQWVTVADALAAGATPAEVGRAIDTDGDLVVIGLARWASEQHRLGLMSAERHDEVMALVRGEQS